MWSISRLSPGRSKVSRSSKGVTMGTMIPRRGRSSCGFPIPGLSSLTMESRCAGLERTLGHSVPMGARNNSTASFRRDTMTYRCPSWNMVCG